MKRLWSAVRYSAVGMMITGVFSAIAGCSTEDQIRALLMFILMLLTGGGGNEETTTGGGAAAVTEIVLYSAGQQANGDLKTLGAGADGREGADNLCVAAKPADVTNSNVRAFISAEVDGVDPDDDLFHMPDNFGVPTNLPIKTRPGVGGQTIADTWADLIPATTLPDTLDNLGVTDPTDGSALWWSGTHASGLFDQTCFGWVTGTASPTIFGSFGATTLTNSQWVGLGPNTCDISTAELLCIAF